MRALGMRRCIDEGRYMRRLGIYEEIRDDYMCTLGISRTSSSFFMDEEIRDD